MVALADQQAGRHLGFVNPLIYAIARSRAYHRAFHYVITGDNSQYVIPPLAHVTHSTTEPFVPVPRSPVNSTVNASA